MIPYRFQHGGFNITLIDTPGFNDTLRSETEVLKEIADWLDVTYRNNVRLTGIIYLQALTDRKMYGSSLRNLKMFRQLCGDNPLKNVVLATTGWGTAEKSGNLQKAADNENQLETDPDFWEPMIKRGSTTARFTDTQESALEIIMSLAGRAPVTLQIQRELVEEEKNLIDTAAGTTVNEEMKKLEAKYKAEVSKIQQEMDEALSMRDQEMHDALDESKQAFQRRLDQVRLEQQTLTYERRNEHRRLQEELEETKWELKRTAQQQKEDHELQLRAQRVEDQMHFDQIVAQLRQNSDKVRAEERIFLEEKIREVEAKPTKKKGKGVKILCKIAPLLGSVAMSLLGFPMLLGDPSGLMDLFSSDG